ncbi:methylmalonyl-CoA mutase family protein [Litorimonas haliclonae]|uniref:methylmalonyl-CoA mutase family protein n=1 Tax=Litorimonas haliclonae TaxID=2081977 RepID=UPI0039EEE49F
MTDIALTNKFETPSRDEWAEQVKKGLKDAGFESLLRQTDDDLERGPFFSAKDLPETLTPQSRLKTPLLDERPWHMCTPARDPDIRFANKQVLADLKGGASALDITLSTDALKLTSRADLKRLLEGVWINLVPLRFNITSAPIETAQLIKSHRPLAESVVDLGLDPISLLLSGDASESFSLDDLLDGLPDNWTALCVNAAAIHDQGGTEAQELSVMAASAAHYWRQYGPKTKLSVRLAADRDGHLGIAKVRAARKIITRIAESFGVSTDIPIHSVSSLRMMQSIDPWTNLLRVMASGFGAVCGGADYITLRPFTDAPSDSPRLATPFGYRIARNMQLMMMEESHLGQVNDAAHGSYFHEALTQKIAEAAWTEFQAIETGGGIEGVIASGALQKSIAAAKSDRDTKNDPILGVTLHRAEETKPAKLREAAK